MINPPSLPLNVLLKPFYGFLQDYQGMAHLPHQGWKARSSQASSHGLDHLIVPKI
jgi:hypothetical protein